MTDTRTDIDSFAVRSAALHAIGFLYDTEGRIFYRSFPGEDLLILPRDFVANVGNETFFKEYYHLRRKVRKAESHDGS